MGQDATFLVQNSGFRRDNLAASPERPSFRPNTAGGSGNWARKIDLGFDGRVAGTGRKQGMARTPPGAIDHCESPTAMNATHRIEKVRSRFALEDGEAVADLCDPEGHNLGDRRLRQVT